MEKGKSHGLEEDDNSKGIEAKSIQRCFTSHLPDSILFDIFSKLPVKTLVRFRLVSKSWLDLISSRQFVKSHFGLTSVKAEENKSTISYFHRLSGFVYVSIIDPQASKLETFCLKNAPYNNVVPNCGYFRILGSCNGLILISRGAFFWLWNHSTGEYKKLVNCTYWRRQPCTPSSSIDHFIYGLGYDSILNDYKAVIFRTNMEFPYRQQQITFMYLCTSCIRTGQWRMKSNVSNFPYDISNDRIPNRLGVTVNGSPHWVVSDFNRTKSIIYFDMAEKKVKKLASPQIPYVEQESLQLSILGGCLCATYMNLPSKCFDIWAMKEYGVNESWTILHVIRKSETALRVRPIGFINNGVEIILEILREIDLRIPSTSQVDSLVSYNLNTKGEIFILPIESATTAISFQSLISPLMTSK